MQTEKTLAFYFPTPFLVKNMSASNKTMYWKRVPISQCNESGNDIQVTVLFNTCWQNFPCVLEQTHSAVQFTEPVSKLNTLELSPIVLLGITVLHLSFTIADMTETVWVTESTGTTGNSFLICGNCNLLQLGWNPCWATTGHSYDENRELLNSTEACYQLWSYWQVQSFIVYCTFAHYS